MLDKFGPFLHWLDPNHILKASDWIALTAVLISLLGILVTAWFSYIVYKVSQRTAHIAQASFVLSKAVVEQGHQEKHLSIVAKKKQLISIMNNRAEEVINALTRFNPALIENMPRDPGISVADLVEYFNDEEKEKIESTWSNVWPYIRGAWHIHGGPFKHDLNDYEMDEARRAGHMLMKEFQDLVLYFRKLN